MANIALLAGETSGDILAAQLLCGLSTHPIEHQYSGIAGSEMLVQAPQFQALAHIDDLAVRGYVEVLRHLPRLLKLRRELKNHYSKHRPDLFIGVDAPDFNLNIETHLKAQGVKTAHFISPSIWAWRPERIEKIRQAVDHMLLIFPFEKAIYDQADIASTYVGHPMADMIPLQTDTFAARAALGLQPNQPVIALLPGSRLAEVEHILPRLLQAGSVLKRHIPELQFVLPVASANLRPAIEKALQANPLTVVCLAGQADLALQACDITLIASGTATLQAALYKKPMVITYAMPRLSYWLMRGKALQPWIGLPNILLQETVVPELVQDAAKPEDIAREALSLLQDEARRRAIITAFTELHHSLRCDMPTRASAVIMQLWA